MLLTHRKLLQSKAIAIENDLRKTLRNFGLKVGMVGTWPQGNASGINCKQTQKKKPRHDRRDARIYYLFQLRLASAVG
jgi:hypothetical protein